MCFIAHIGNNIDFDSTPQIVAIIAGTNSSTIQIRVMSDSIIEKSV